MAGTRIELLDEDRLTEVDGAVSGGSLRVAPEGLEAALGWHLEAEGLCRGDVCVPVADHAGLIDEHGIDLARFAELIGRPVALDTEHGCISVGTSALEHGAALRSGVAPDFSLPDLAGRRHTLSEQRGKKVLLIAYASW